MRAAEADTSLWDTYHYKTISKIHKKWADNGVYMGAYNELVMSNNLTKNDSGTIVLLVDSTLIINKSGIEMIGYGTQCKKKKYTKISLMSNLDGKNVAVGVDNVKDKVIKDFNGDDKKIKTLNLRSRGHDVKGVEPLIKDIRKTNKNDPIEVYGDKGYVIGVEDKNRIKKMFNSKVIYTKRSNPTGKGQKTKNTKKEKNVLKFRYRVEIMISKIKVYNRIHIRRDKSINSYLGFVHLGLILKFGYKKD